MKLMRLDLKQQRGRLEAPKRDLARVIGKRCDWCPEEAVLEVQAREAYHSEIYTVTHVLLSTVIMEHWIRETF